MECNPFFQHSDEEKYLKSENILMQAWSPLAARQDDLLNNEVIPIILFVRQIIIKNAFILKVYYRRVNAFFLTLSRKSFLICCDSS